MTQSPDQARAVLARPCAATGRRTALWLAAGYVILAALLISNLGLNPFAPEKLGQVFGDMAARLLHWDFTISPKAALAPRASRFFNGGFGWAVLLSAIATGPQIYSGTDPRVRLRIVARNSAGAVSERHADGACEAD